LCGGLDVKTQEFSAVMAPPDPIVDGIDNELCLESGQVNALQAVVAIDLRWRCRRDAMSWDPVEPATDFKR
jgi:hypothetical protein